MNSLDRHNPQVGRDSWSSLCLALSGRPSPDSSFPDLVTAYSEPGRRYHTLDHIALCLGQLELVRESLEYPCDVAFAIWFHDAIYDPHRHDNEEKSAAWAARVLSELGKSIASIERIRQLILDTRHAASPCTTDGMFIADIDLAILGQPHSTFWGYEDAVRDEYSWVPAEQFCEGRIAILNGFLSRPRIYATEAFFARYESPARHNVQQAVRKLMDELNQA